MIVAIGMALMFVKRLFILYGVFRLKPFVIAFNPLAEANGYKLRDYATIIAVLFKGRINGDRNMALA